LREKAFCNFELRTSNLELRTKEKKLKQETTYIPVPALNVEAKIRHISRCAHLRTAALAGISMLTLLLSGCGHREARNYADRWFYASTSFKTAAAADSLCALVTAAAVRGLNGLVLSAGLDDLSQKTPEYFRQLARLDSVCRQQRIEIIPCIFSVGRAYSLLAHNRHLAAGLHAENAVYLARDESTAVAAPDPGAFITNGGFEAHKGDRLQSFWLQDRPGNVSFADTVVSASGRVAVRFDNFKKSFRGHGRVMQEINVRRHREYVVTCRVKTAGLEPTDAFRILPLTRDRRNLAPRQLGVPSTTDWTTIELPFNSLNNENIRLYAGTWNAVRGQVWIDDLAIREVPLVNALVRPGTPLDITNQRTGQACRPGIDYQPIQDSAFNLLQFDRPSPVMRLLPGGGVRPGDTLRISYWHPLPVERDQITACMSEPEVYDIWTREMALLAQTLKFKTVFLDMDEVRVGGCCQTCRARNLSMAQILGDCITRQCGIVRAAVPQARIAIWSDMLDPGHNAINNYYLMKGDLTETWKYVPTDLTIMCWHAQARKKNVRFFAQHGFPVMASVCRDPGKPGTQEEWLRVLGKAPDARGMMFTTWTGDYAGLGEFGERLK
jgi:hypothetical protein